jgi:dGTPase
MSPPADLCTREQFERLEHELLRPVAAFADVSWARPQTEAPDPFRTCFVRDRDRVLHCGAFRRLKHKTQVFVADRDDFYRTRLTHTLEVAQIARFVARTLRLNESLAEVLALVHDIGHPPFGHEGERILDEITGVPFDHNRQALRIVDVIESPYPDRRGLNLTHLVRRMILKHGGDAGWGAEPTVGHVLEAQLTDLSDSLAYQHHDLEDGLRSGVLREEELSELPIWRRASEDAGLVPEGPRGLKARLNRMLKTSLFDLLEHTDRLLQDCDAEDATDVAVQVGKLVAFSPPRAAEHAELMRFLYARFYRSEEVVRSRAVAEEALGTIVTHYRSHPGELPEAYRRRLDDDGVELTVCDYAAGMTDRFALEEWQRLNAPRATVSAAPVAPPVAPATPPVAPDDPVTLLESRIGYRFRDRVLALMALTHASARSDEFPPNERLEFLGDAVLGMVVAQECYRRYPDQPEGELSRIKATTVNRHALGAVADEWGLRPLIQVGAGFRDREEVPRSIVSDAVEAVLGAVLLDGGVGEATPLIVAAFGARIDLAAEGSRSRNAKSELQTWTQGQLGLTPNYRLVEETGPDHCKEFKVAVVVGERDVAVAAGRNKRQAEQRAAQAALRSLKAEADPDEDGTTGAEPA